MSTHLVTIQNCSVYNSARQILPSLNWQMDAGEAWLITGANGCGSADFIRALAGDFEFIPSSEDALFSNVFKESVAIVSLEKAASLIEEERVNDESEILNKIDEGRTGRRFLCEVLGGSTRRHDPLPEIAQRLETLPEVKLCGVQNILDRGLKFMSTGEVRRMLLCRALLSGCKLLILSNPFAGLDASSRAILLEFFDSMAKRQTNTSQQNTQDFPHVILCTDRFTEIPESINRVLEFTESSISFCGTKEEYQKVHSSREEERSKTRAETKQAFLQTLQKIREETKVLTEESQISTTENSEQSKELIRFNNVNVGWDEHKVLINMNWTVMQGEHWFIRGPNGSGKTTMLELITGDNMQVFREDVRLFGKRRGSGETIWDIRKNLGIVSYRLHVEYRMVGDTTIQNTIISGFHDSIGLYESATDFEKATALAWLRLAGLGGKENAAFNTLSYGQQRAVLILRAAVKSPRVLILDEPCHGLDEANRQLVLDLLETIAQTGTTTLLHVTHDPSEALACEKHILELHPGEEPMYCVIENAD